MRTNNKLNKPENRSFIEDARRAQIVDCAIEVIATKGFVNTSISRIAEEAGISKGVISYHFLSKEELIQQVVMEVYQAGAIYMDSHMKGKVKAKDILKAYIESNLAFMGDNPKKIIAVTEILANARTKEGKRLFDVTANDQFLAPIIQLLELGQQDGSFRALSTFSAKVLATTIRDTIDGVGFQLALDPNLDLESYSKELKILFDLATRKEEII
ncbi:TetR/AcrR family transcriptional regulator [Lysinibacillus sp. NPDC097195]|uniref:TetR/AcrR family transcriptional regulator n=1 Tax=Lysinibacillus sp. NPDC097195 TaxID=3364141 RepID=UPI0038051105